MTCSAASIRKRSSRKPDVRRANERADRGPGDDLRRPPGRWSPAPTTWPAWSARPCRRLVALGVLRDRPDLLTPPPGSAGAGRRGRRRRARASHARPCSPGSTDHLDRRARAPAQGADASRSTGSCSTAPSAPPTWAAIEELIEAGTRAQRWPRATRLAEELQALRAALEKPFADRLLLWQKTKDDLVEEMEHGACRCPAGATSSPSRSSTGSRCSRPACGSPVGVKVFGSNLDEIQRVSQEIAAVLREVRGAADVVPRPDRRQGLCRDPDRPREGGPLRDQRRRHPGRRRGRDGRQAR